MKKVFVVSKTHLDLGFTDFAEVVRKKYINEFIPGAIALANSVNTPEKKSFIWTTGSWIIKEALHFSDENKKEALVAALKNGYLVPHGLPFTLHSEVLDADTFDYGLSVVDEIDALRGKKTVAAKMTDVPGHTKGIIPLLSKHGIKLLHIGVNGVSAVPELPECFLWRCGDSEVIVIYSGDYGGAYKSDVIDEVLYFDHTVDNRGAPSPEKVLKKLGEIEKEFPGYEVSAGTLDEYAELLWEKKDELPVYEGEIGDTWIHGSAADPFKSASLRTLMRLKSEWLSDGTMKKDSDEYRGFSDALICIAEHTCGIDSKMGLADYENYLKADFNEAYERDTVVMTHPEYPYNLEAHEMLLSGTQGVGSYSTMEKSWEEQRVYIKSAVSSLSLEHKKKAGHELLLLKPEKLPTLGTKKSSLEASFGDFALKVNEYGGMCELTYKGRELISGDNKPIFEYRSYSKADYDRFFENYTRNMKENFSWGYADFGKPLLEYADGKYPTGSFFYKVKNTEVKKEADSVKLLVALTCDERLFKELGAPKNVALLYCVKEDAVTLDVFWSEKDANRIPEAIFLHMYPKYDVMLKKLCAYVDYKDVANKGGKSLHAVEKCIMDTPFGTLELINRHSPLVSPGKGKILEYDNKTESVKDDGLAYNLYNNCWGTNFPLWYRDNARFTFDLIFKEK